MFIDSIINIVYFSGYLSKDLWLYIPLLYFCYFSLQEILFDMDSLMIYLKYTNNFFFVGIYLVYRTYLLLNIQAKHCILNTPFCLLFCNKFFVMLLIVSILSTYCNFSLKILMSLLIRISGIFWFYRHYNFLESFLLI